MPKPIRFTDAARLLGADESTMLAWFDGLLSAGLAVAAPFTAGATIGLFDPKNDLVKWLGKMRRASGDRVRGADRRTRGEVLTAAHTLLVTAAFFDTLAETDRLVGDEWDGPDQWRTLFDTVPEETQRGIVRNLLTTTAPVPTPTETREALRLRIRHFYGPAARRILTLLQDRGHQSSALEHHVLFRLPSAALARYDGYVHQLAGQSLEFLSWTFLGEAQATRATLQDGIREIADAVAEQRTGLAGLRATLEALPGMDGTARLWVELSRIYAYSLNNPIVSAGTHGAPPGLVLPTLRDSYINHAFRAISYDAHAHRPHDDSWWEKEIPPRDEIQAFLAACLAAPESTTQPILLLGLPGAGKSVLTRVLAAQLGDTGHPAVRVDLRRVPADAPIHRQVTEALALTLNRTVDWAELADTAGSATPVILFDGFDELIQSSQASRTDYLEQVADFQRAEAARGHPVVAVVTSRTIVADRARIPAGATVVRLEPFDPVRTTRWLATWNAANTDFFATTGLRPLTTETIARHPHLPRQPLLLLMLALYDADANSLQLEREALADADLYERLLHSFARREVLKQHADADDVESLVEQELERLSIAAFAMFNRDAQVVTETDLNDDLTALSGETPSRYGTNRRRMSDARLLIGRFFFVHAAESTYGVTGEAPLRAYEFLHATFGEYLVARLTVKTTTALYESTRGRRTLTTVAQTVDDGLLTALLSYQVLTMRGPILEFLGHLFADRPPEERAGLHQLLLDLLHDCLEAYDPGRFAGYRPRHLSLTSRLATRSANLIILLLALTNAPIEYNSLWPDADNPTDTWQRLSRLWQATLEKESWDSLAKALSATPWHSPTAVQTGPTPRFGRDAFTDWGLFWNLVAANSLIGDDLVRSLLISVQPLVERNDAIFTTPESGLSPARLIIEFWQGFAYRDHFSFIHMNDIFDLCLDAANGLDYVGQHQYLLMLFEALSRTGVAMSVEALTRAATLVMDGSGWSALEAAHLIAAIGNAFRQTTPRDQRLRDIALGVASTFNEARHFQPEPERLWVAMALAEMGVTPPTGHGLRLEELLEHPGAAWRLIHNDEDAFRRLVRAARYAEHDSAAAAVLGILDMMPGPKLAALPWRDVLITVARANHENPALAEKVVTAWDRARKRLKLTTGAVTT